MPDYEEMDVYGEWTTDDVSYNIEIGQVDLEPGNMPDMIEIDGYTYVREDMIRRKAD